MSKTVLQLLAVAGTLDILTAQFMFDYNYDFNHYQQAVEGESGSTNGGDEEYQVGPQGMLWDYDICPELSRHSMSLEGCKDKCSHTDGCTAFNYDPYWEKCELLKCPLPVPEPAWNYGKGWRGYSISVLSAMKLEEYQVGPQGMLWDYDICPELGRHSMSLEGCKDKCSYTDGCTAFNYDPGDHSGDSKCELLKCPLPVPEPAWNYGWGWRGYSISGVIYKFHGPFDNTFSDAQCEFIDDRNGISLTKCLTWCVDESTCTAVNFNRRHNGGSCVRRACPVPIPRPTGHETDPEWKGYSHKTVPEIMWHADGRCGPRNVLPDNRTSQCDPHGENPCCNMEYGWCGNTRNHCYCKNCVDFRGKPVITSAHTTLPPTGKRHYEVYRGHFADRQCPQIGLFEKKSNTWCKKECDRTPGCTAVNTYIHRVDTPSSLCSLRACGLDPPYPIGEGQQSYSLIPIAKGYTRYSLASPDKYFTVSQQGCFHLHPTRHNQSYVQCQETCDMEAFCTGFNFNLKNFDCEMFYCDDPTVAPKGVKEKNWEAWAKIKFAEGYNGPVLKYYSSTQEGCFHIHPTHANTGYADCEKLCDEEPYCVAFNHNIKTLTCELFYCRNAATPPEYSKHKNWKSYSKRTFIKPLQRLYFELEDSTEQDHVNDKSCYLIGDYKSQKSLETCMDICDIEQRLCKGFYFNPKVEVGCILQTCGKKSPFSNVQRRGWKGYVVQRPHVHGWSRLKMACIMTGIYRKTRYSEMSYCQDKCRLDREKGVACKSISYEISSKSCKFSFNGSTSDNYTLPCDGHIYTEILENVTEISTPTQPPITVPRKYSVYTGKYFLHWQCPFLVSYDGQSHLACRLRCDAYPNCTVFNSGNVRGPDATPGKQVPPKCSLYACGNSPPNPFGKRTKKLVFEGWSIKKDIRDYGAINVKIMDSSKPHQAYLGPEMVLDGSNSTFWNPEPNLRSWYITFNLGDRHKVTKMHLSNYGDGEHDVTQFKLEISYNNVNWYLSLESDVRAMTNESQTFEGFRVTIGKFLRFTVTNTSGYQPWITELGFWGLSEEGFKLYDGPEDKYYTKASGCVPLKPTYRNITYIECEEYCDNEHYCTAFNLDVATRNCELWFCTARGGLDITPLGVDKTTIKSWRRKDHKVTSPHSYIIQPGTEGKSYSNKQCRPLGTMNNAVNDDCKRHCDLTPQCNAYNFASRGCVLRACGQHPPHPCCEDEVSGTDSALWQGYVLEEKKLNYGNAWYYGPHEDKSFSRGNCIGVQTLAKRGLSLVECEEACDNNPWCTGFDYHKNIQPNPSCQLYACKKMRTVPTNPRKGIESWSKYEFTERGHVCGPGQTKSAGDTCNTCFCFGGRWDCTENYCLEETTKKKKLHLFFNPFFYPFSSLHRLIRPYVVEHIKSVNQADE